MDEVLNNFNKRSGEIDKYIKALKILEAPGAKITTSTRRPYTVESDVIKTMKASCFLMIYNLVESSIRAAMESLYSDLNTKSKTLSDLKEKIKDTWIDQQFLDMEPLSANQTSYRKLVREMINSVIMTKPIELSPEKLPISGNLDANGIRNLFGKHDINSKAHHRSLQGAELKTVKDQRNSLAHGNTSFTECGQQYAINDIESIKRQTTIYLRSLLKNIKKYIEDEKYAA